MTPDVKLSLSVAPGLGPFALSKQEEKMTPEDWAWRFLRLNQDYLRAYSAASEKQAATPESRIGMSRFREEHPHRTVYVDEQECRDLFGLSTWLDPNKDSLPELEEGQSWFAPLRSVCVKYAPDLQAVRFNACDGLFGLLAQRPSRGIKIDIRGSSGSKQRPLLSAAIDFVVDVSVPLDGQLASVSWLTDRYVEMFRESGLSSSAFDKKIDKAWTIVGEFSESTGDERGCVFVEKLSRKNKNEPENSTQALNESREIYADSIKSTGIHINLARSVGKQLSDYHTLVNDKRRWLIENGLINKPPYERFWSRLGATRGRGEGTPSDGHALKAYVLIAECHHQGITRPDDIFDVLEGKGAKKRSSFAQLPDDDWVEYARTRADRFKDYAENAKAYIKDDYKWLVRSQNP